MGVSSQDLGLLARFLPCRAGSSFCEFAVSGPGFWNDDKRATLRHLWVDEHYSSAKIAERLGCTRNAVIGQVNRMGLTRVKMTAEVERRTDPPKPRRPRDRLRRPPTAIPVDPAPIPTPDPIEEILAPLPEAPETPEPNGRPTLVELGPGDCRWPMNNPPMLGRFVFCGDPAQTGKPYCPNHCKLSYTPLIRRDRLTKAELRTLAAE
jgi:GcrA cell cycle regulator